MQVPEHSLRKCFRQSTPLPHLGIQLVVDGAKSEYVSLSRPRPRTASSCKSTSRIGAPESTPTTAPPSIVEKERYLEYLQKRAAPESWFPQFAALCEKHIPNASEAQKREVFDKFVVQGPSYFEKYESRHPSGHDAASGERPLSVAPDVMDDVPSPSCGDRHHMLTSLKERENHLNNLVRRPYSAKSTVGTTSLSSQRVRDRSQVAESAREVLASCHSYHVQSRHVAVVRSQQRAASTTNRLYRRHNVDLKKPVLRKRTIADGATALADL